VSENYGEPISAGATARAGDPGELTLRFESGFDLPRIERLLQEARERGGRAPETICTLNLVAIYFNEQQYERARSALEMAGTIHPSRLIVVIGDELIPEESLTVRASVVRSAGAITLERVVLYATGRAIRHLQSAMTGLLRPDLPRVVVWGGRPHGALMNRAVEAADRIVIDSGARPPRYLGETAALVAKGAPFGDLAWARIFPWQALAADTFDLPNLREHRGNIRKARVVCAGAVGAEGLLLLGWMQSRIKKLQVEIHAEGEAESDETATAIPRAEPMGLGQVKLLELVAPPATFTLRRERGLLFADVKGDDDGYCANRVRLPPDTPGRLLALELNLLSGVDELYAQAVQAAAKLLAQVEP